MAKKPFFSWKWQIILLLLTTLTLVFALAQAVSYQRQQQEFSTERHQANLEHLNRLNATIQASYRRLSDIARTLALLYRSDPQPPVSQQDTLHVEQQAAQVQLQGIVDLIQLYRDDGSMLRAWGDPIAIEPAVIRDVPEREQPARGVVCHHDCLRYVAVPVRLRGGETAVLLVASLMHEVVPEYHRQSHVDLGLLRIAATVAGAEQSPEILSLTQRAAHEAMLEDLDRGSWLKTINTPLVLDYGGRSFELLLSPLVQDASATVYWLLVSDITAPLQAMRQRQLFDALLSVVAILLALIVLALMLRRPLRFLGLLAQQLPQLARVGGMRKQELQALSAGLHRLAYRDELNALADSAVELASRLDELEDSVAHHTLNLERRSAALQRERDFVTSLFDTAEAVILTQSKEGVIRSLNQHGSRLLGLRLPLSPGCRFDSIGLDAKSEDAQLQLLYEGKIKRLQLDTRFVAADGRELHLSWQHSRLREAGAGDAYILSIGIDMTERRNAESRLYWLANHDPLTRLPNRLLFFEALELRITESENSGQELALLCCDIDDFKSVNDTLGHSIGDQLLQAVGRRIGEVVANDCHLARLGADEFILMLQSLDARDAATGLAQDLIRSLVEPFHLDGYEIFSSIGIGISLFPEHGSKATDLIKSADLAMIEAKEQGQGRYRVYHAAEGSLRVERFTLANELRRATERGDFSLQYQPKVNALSGLVSGMEALVRWQHPEFGPVSPSRFIPLAEEMGLIVPLGRWVLNEACRQMAQWQRDGMVPVRIGVNLAGPQIAHDSLLQEVDEALSAAGLPARLLDLEITESFVIRQPDIAISKLGQLRERGISLSMDDFGTGYSSLSYLKRLPINTLKIDQSFVRDIGQDSDDEAIVKAIIVMCRSLGIDVLAEGVETAEQLSFLLRHGCAQVQGYYYSCPLDPSALWDFVDQHGSAD